MLQTLPREGIARVGGELGQFISEPHSDRMADNVSFKVYLKDPSVAEGAEVRRFVVDKDVSTSLIYIKEKLISVFPVLADRVFSVSWTDDDRGRLNT